MRGQCGSEGLFGASLPCANNTLAEDPTTEVRKKLVDICGASWNEGPICCAEDQLEVLKSNLKRADGLIASCPACRDNFVNLFCTFTCSPDQSLFVNVTTFKEKNGKSLVTELDHLVSDKYGSGFYDSCKDVKFGATNGRAMDLIGGGATNYTGFLKFLGDKKFLGSPFQMNFPRPSEEKFPGMTAMDKTPWPCNTTNELYRCQCVDCAGSCVELPKVVEAEHCRVGALSCLSFGVIIVYSVFLVVCCFGIAAHVALQKRAQVKTERMRLLHDISPSDDEDEGDVIHNVAMMDRPQTKYTLNEVFDRIFSRIGYTCASFPAITISTSIIFVIILSLGWMRFTIETDPVRLWVAPDSDAAKEKQFFDESFGPFFRAEQVFLVNDTTGNSPVLSYDTLRWWFDVEDRISRLRAPGGIGLQDVCYKPTGEACVVQSVTGWFGGDVDMVEPSTWDKQIVECAKEPVNCLPPYGNPLEAKFVLGGHTGKSLLDANAMVTTWVVKNYLEGTEGFQRAEIWENELQRALMDVQRDAKHRGLRLSFNTEASLEKELNKSTNTDANIVAISYVIMFIYASLALGSTTLTLRSILRNPTTALVQSKFMLGLFGILIVLMSVSASVGLFSALGVKVTLIIAEVIPFLVLAVGVDNIFLLVHEFERVNHTHPEKTVADRMARTLGRMGPSILLSASTETIAFALGAVVGMPAVRNFAIYAAGAVFINAILQITMFTSALALNQLRVEAGRVDCVPCVRVSRRIALDMDVMDDPEDSGLQRFIANKYAPFLLNKKVKAAVLVLFLGLFSAGLALLPSVQLGLDQRIALPSDSYLIDYFNDLDHYFEVGPPVYFVTKHVNVTERIYQQELCGRFSSCKPDSLSNLLEGERKRPEISYIANGAASWIDDFFLYLNPENADCCVDAKGNPCFENRTPPYNYTLYGMPEGTEFVRYVEKWLKQTPDENCPVAGQAAYGDAVVVNDKHTTIDASHFRTFHTALHSQNDFISAYKSARRISQDAMDRQPGLDIFPYSKFYIFFDQYISIVKLSAGLLGSAIGLSFLLSAILLGSVQTALVVNIVVAMTVIDIIGAMAVFNVSLNAISLVNLVICVGISLEFCAHIARAFQFPSTYVLDRAPRHRFRNKDARAWTAMVNVGASVFSGITITKLLGVAVLAFTRSKIFEIYYFRVWLCLVVLAALHALVLLPVVLSMFGGKGK